MSNQQAEMKQIKRLIAIWIGEIRLNNYENYLDINKVSEHLCRQLLNKIYGYQLEDLNRIASNFPGLDIGDKTKELIAYQVTSRIDNAKIIDALETVVANDHQKVFINGIRFLILNDVGNISFGKKAKKTPEKILNTFKLDTDVMYPHDLVKAIEDIYEKEADPIKFNQIKNLLEKELIPISSGRIPSTEKSETEKLSELLAIAIQKLGEQDEKTVKVSSTFFNGDLQVPPISVISSRRELVKQVIDLCSTYNVLWLQGGPSMGKTSLAVLSTKEIKNPSLWIECRDIEPEQLIEHLLTLLTKNLKVDIQQYYQDSLIKISQAIEANTLIILNDLPDLKEKIVVQQRLSELLVQLSDHSIKIIVTSIFPIVQQIESQLAPNITSLAVPPLSEIDTITIFQHFGATEEDASLFAGLITKTTEGHPVLIRSAARFLAAKNWKVDEETIVSIFTVKFGDSSDKESYAKVLANTSNQQARELLYRLRLVIGSFDIDSVRRIAGLDPVISHPGEVLSQVKDIWIQDLGNGQMQLSPLLKGLEGNIQAEVEKQVNKQLAIGIIEKGNISQLDAFEAIHYFSKAEEFNQATATLLRVLTEFTHQPELFFDWHFNLFWWNTRLPSDVIPFIKIQIRILQITVGRSQNKDYDFLIADLREIVLKEEIGALGLVSYNLFFFEYELKKNPILAFKHLTDLQKASIEIKKQGQIESTLVSDEVLNGIWLIFSQLNEKETYKEWFELYKSIDVPYSVLDAQTNTFYVMACVSICRNTVSRNKEKQAGIEEIFRFIASNAVSLDLDMMAAYAVKYLIKYLTELKWDSRVAQKLIEEYDSVVQTSTLNKFLILAEVGCRFFYSGDYDAANYYFGEIEDILPSGEMHTEVLDYLIAYMQTISKTNSSLSADLVEKAHALAFSTSFYMLEDKVKLSGEAAIIKVANKKYDEALELYSKGFNLLLDHFSDTAEQHALIIRYGNALKYVLELLEEGTAKSYASGGHVIPETGYFYRTNDKLLEGGFYFDERKYMVANAIQVCYEALGNIQLAKDWAYKSFSIALNIEDPKYVPILQLTIFYLIQDRKIRQAYNIQAYIDSYYLKLKQKQKNNDLDNELNELINAIEVNDLNLYFHILLPISMTFSLDIIKGDVQSEQYLTMINDAFNTDKYKIKDEEAFNFARQLFNQIMIHRISYEEMQKQFSAYTGAFKDILYIIGCLLLSSFTNATQSAHLQLAVIATLDTVSRRMKFMYQNFIVPYFQSFWKYKVIRNPREFTAVDHLKEKGLSLIEKTDIHKRVAKIFTVLKYHLEIEIPFTAEDFINEDRE